MRLRHPVSGATYARNDDGTVTVTGRTGGRGLFNRRGNWIEGDLWLADPLMCMFVSDGFSMRQRAGSAVLEAAINTGADQ